MKNTVKTDPVLAFFLSPKELRIEAARLRHIAAALDRRLPTLADDSARSIQLARISDLRRQAAEKQKTADRREVEVAALIDALPTAAGQTILRLRYCEGLRWCPGKSGRPCVLHAMHETGLYYSERQMYRMHNQALAEARRLFASGRYLAASA